MTGSDLGRAMGDAIFAMIVVVAVVCVSFGALAVWGLPKLWTWLRPLIHALTA